jgi:(2Fe-2S) ferredoxin
MHYKRHIFFCGNKKSNETGCGYFGSEESFNFTKKYLKGLDLWGTPNLRASKAGCLGRCEDAPVCVIYPDGIWYTYVDLDDIKEIIDSHLINGSIVSRLQL